MSEERRAQPAIAVTIGDPAGIGAEVVVKALSDPAVAPLARWVIVGDQALLDRARDVSGVDVASLETVTVSHVDAINGSTVVPGKLDAACGRAAVTYVREATEMCLRQEAVALVTAPVNKEAVALSGVPFSGHTEYIAELCGGADSRMMLTNRCLSVVHVTTHVALREACNATAARIVRTITLGHEAMAWLGRTEPRIAVAGLNPHAGEHGLFGREEQETIQRAIETVCAQGIRCEGPFAPDTIFLEAWRGQWDLVVAMYHDQGHIPMKLLDFANTVNVTLGIPIIRTSVDHGTAFDIAGRNLADPTSMKAALRLAAHMAGRRAATHAAPAVGL
ncbi:MAG: 4-hydroxythreonine-4-phosphate dehydrogenase PdxA [Luteitalea sp.]|nr:4-hydroxythreonine-4-phosphate dehydrogenase PdxA [Luteitalea sp.]